MFKYTLSTDTELRLLEPSHSMEVYAAVDENRDHLHRWLPWVDMVGSVEDIKLTHNNLIQLADNGSFAVGIWQQGRLAGVVGIHEIDWRNRRTSIGYWLAADCQRQGIMTRTCQAVLGYLFGTLNLHSVVIRAAVGNLPSQAVARRLGFRHEGTARQSEWLTDGPVDQMVFALLREEWQDSGERLAFSHPLTDEAELRMLLPHYAEEIFTLTDRNRALLRPIMTWIDATTCVEDSRGFIRYALRRMAEGAEVHWGIWHHGSFAGAIGTLPINWQARSTEFGYWLGEEFQGKGVMTAAGRAMIAHLFHNLDLNRVELHIRTDNARSRALAERLGFTQECMQRQAMCFLDDMVDIASYGLLKGKWEE